MGGNLLSARGQFSMQRPEVLLHGGFAGHDFPILAAPIKHSIDERCRCFRHPLLAHNLDSSAPKRIPVVGPRTATLVLRHSLLWARSVREALFPPLTERQ